MSTMKARPEDNEWLVNMEGAKVLDPRTGERKMSDNPALILGHLAEKKIILVEMQVEDEKRFWSNIGKMADFCEVEVRTEIHDCPNSSCGHQWLQAIGNPVTCPKCGSGHSTIGEVKE